MRQKAGWLYLSCEILCIILSVGFALMCCYSNSPLFLDYGTDSPIFLTVGKAMMAGRAPYVDIVENKGPLLFVLNALPQFLVAGTTGVFVLELLMSIGACLLILRAARYLQSGALHAACAVIPVACYYCALSLHLEGGNFGEEYNVFLTVMSIAILTRAVSGKRRHTRWQGFGLGAACAAVALIKISDIFGVGVTALFYAAYVIKEKKGFWRELCAFAGGVAAVAAPIFAYLIATGSVGAMFQEYILSNFSHVSGGEGIGFIAQRMQMLLSDSRYAQASLLPVWMALMAAAVVVMLWLGRRRDLIRGQFGWLASYGVALGAAVMLGGYVSATGYEQHLIVTAAPVMLSALLVTTALAALLDGWPLLVKGISELAALMLAVWMVYSSQIFIPQRPFVTSEAYLEDVSYQTEFLERLEDDKDSVFCINVPREWYCFNDVLPAYKYINLVNYINNGVGTGCDVDFEQYLIHEGIDWLVIQGELEHYRGILTDDTLDYIQQNYELDTMDSREERSLYRLI